MFSVPDYFTMKVYLIIGSVLVFGLIILRCSVSATDNVKVTDQPTIDVVARDQFHSIIRQNNYVLLLLTKSVTPESAKAEVEVQKVKHDVLSNFQIRVFKMENALQFAKEFGLTTLPGLLFFRKSKPIAYEGAIEENAVYEWLQNNLQSSLQNLDDQNFEHLTQSASGATTGDWFVLFCNMSTYACRSLESTWETTAAQLKNRLNVALVDVQMTPELIERFKIFDIPSIKLFHHGKMYQYSFDKFDVSTLTKFALGWYKNVKHDSVPAEKTPFDNLIDKIVQIIQRELADPYAVPSIVMLLLPFSIVVAAIVALGRDYKSKFE